MSVLEPLLLREVQFIKGVGPRRAERLHKKWGILNLLQLLHHVPRVYRDYSAFKPIALLTPGEEEVTVRGRVASHQEKKPRKGLSIQVVRISDGSGTAAGVWFNQPWVIRGLPVGAEVILSGRPQRQRGDWEFQNPEHEVIDEDTDPIHAGRIVPVYPLTEGLRPREMRRLMHAAVTLGAGHMPELLPAAARERHGLLPAPEAWRAVHFAADRRELDRALRTLKFTDFFLLQTAFAVLRAHLRDRQEGIAHAPDGDLSRRFLASLPFPLTGAQRRVIAEIKADMEAPRAMQRLLQGDVGAGKTVVAAAALVKAVEGGGQGALMVPTEILAEQHFLGLRRLLDPLAIRVDLVVGGARKSQRDALRDRLRTGATQIAVGTHALLEADLAFADLSLVITDEQHRFGVRQRGALSGKGRFPDVLVMTATPIPRTLALAAYGDLDISTIDEKPPGRRSIVTVWNPPAKRLDNYRTLVDRFIARGQQAYVIAPLVEESDRLQARAATELQQELSAMFPPVRFGLLHGRMKTDEKDAVMAAFRAGAVQVLVATTVVEVGIDVPNATVILIEEADRFGLAQLHQLRGRVGRGQEKSYCVLIADPKTAEGKARLRIMTRTQSGFTLAEEDLKLRGHGEFFGTRQHGKELEFADIVADAPLLELARGEAAAVVAADPRLGEQPLLRAAIQERWGERLGYILVG